MEPRISIITLGVADLARSFRFYKEGLGLPTTRSPSEEIIFFQTTGVCLALYPIAELAKDVDPKFSVKEDDKQKFSGITIAHNTKTKDQVDESLERAEKAGGKIEKKAQVASWGGYSGYFSDPDGYLWEVAYSESWDFRPDGSLVIT